MEEFKTYRLGDLLTIKYGKDHKLLQEGNIPVYGSGGIMRYANQALYDGPSILIPRKGSLNNIMYTEKSFWTVDTMFWTIVNNQKVNPKYLYYSIYKNDFASMDVGSAVPSLTVPVIEAMEVALPSRQMQDKIAAILSSLDDKIEVNRRINDNLEQQAQALFRSWFVDFEPFGGTMPKDWRVLLFEDFLQESRNKVDGQTTPEYSVTNTGIWPRAAKFNKTLSKSSANNKVVRTGDLVFGMSREILNWGVMDDEIGGVSSAYNVYNVNQHVVNSVYLKLFIKNHPAYFTTLIRPAAREGQGIDKGALMQKQIFVPPFGVWNDFYAKYNALMRTIQTKETESALLAQLRDTLLPKLMSGEISVKC